MTVDVLNTIITTLYHVKVGWVRITSSRRNRGVLAFRVADAFSRAPENIETGRQVLRVAKKYLMSVCDFGAAGTGSRTSRLGPLIQCFLVHD